MVFSAWALAGAALAGAVVALAIREALREVYIRREVRRFRAQLLLRAIMGDFDEMDYCPPAEDYDDPESLS
jgi:hypothetical protein